MSDRSPSDRVRPDREPTFVEMARRRQIVDGTIALIAEAGYAGASLSGIAARAGISKAAVLYHFTGKDQVIAAALGHVIDALVSDVGARVDAAADAAGGGPAAMLEAYVRGMVSHWGEHPTHVRVLAEVLVGGAGPADAGLVDVGSRWEAVAGILAAGQEAGEFRALDPRVLALAIGGAIDGVVQAWLADPTLDLHAAADELVTAVALAVRAGAAG